MKRLSLLACVIALCLPVVANADAVEECHRLAGNPTIALDAIPPGAKEVCAAALDLDDGSPRLLYNYARALEAAHEEAAALRYYGWAADDGFPQARLALERLGVQRQAAPESAADPLETYASDAGSAEALSVRVAQDMRVLPHGAALRQPKVTLALRRGSGPDIARLLAALITARDPDAMTRFGFCISPQLLPAVPSPTIPRMSALLDAARGDPELTTNARASLERFAAVWAAAVAEGEAEAEALARDIHAAAPDFQASEPAALQSLVTVEAHENGAWHAYDPLRGGRFDLAACAAYRTETTLPLEMSPQLHLTLRAAEEGGMRILLDTKVPLADDAVLAFAESWGISPPGDAAQRGEQLYTPVLISGTTTIFGDSLHLPRAPSSPPETGEHLAATMSEVGAVLGGDEPPPAAAPIPVTLRSLEAEVRLGEEGPVHRFTLLKRQNEAPFPDANGAYLDFLQLVTFLPLDGVGTMPEGAGDFVLTEAGLEAQARGAAETTGGFDSLRRALFAELSDAPAPEPQTIGLLATFWTATVPDGPEGQPRLALRNQMWRGMEPASGGDPVRDASAWAVSSVLAERLMLQFGSEEMEPTGPRPDAVALWSAARMAGQPVHVVSNDGMLGALSPDARERAAAQLRAGRILLSPVEPATTDEAWLAWWIVDPMHGLVEDEFADGARQAMAEDAELNKDVACRNVGFFASIGARVARIVAPVVIVLTVTGGGGEVAKAAKQVATAVAKAEEEAEKKRRAIEIASKACAGKSSGPDP